MQGDNYNKLFSRKASKNIKKKIFDINNKYIYYMKVLNILIFIIILSNYFKNKKKYNYYYNKIGRKIFNQNKTLNFTQLDEYFYGIEKNKSDFNHIHILFAFNNEYYLLASVTITSILKTARQNSYIHIHIIAVKEFKFETMKKLNLIFQKIFCFFIHNDNNWLNSLKKKINDNCEFIFYDGSKAEEDFGKNIKYQTYGVGEYAKLLGPVLINKKIDRIITLDSGDLLIQKDLLDLYNYPLDNFLIRGIPDPLAPCYLNYDIFFLKKGYLNGGVYLYNLKKWREMDIYNDIIKLYNHLNFTGKLPTAHQDIVNCFLPSVAVGQLPLRYNFQEFIDLNKNDSQKGANIYINNCSYYYGKKEEVFEGEKNIVIRHYNKYKIYYGNGTYEMKRQWNNYAKLTGFYNEICRKYPKGCE